MFMHDALDMIRRCGSTRVRCPETRLLNRSLKEVRHDDFTVTTTADSGPGSLRAAIEGVNANTSGTPNTIDFDRIWPDRSGKCSPQHPERRHDRWHDRTGLRGQRRARGRGEFRWPRRSGLRRSIERLGHVGLSLGNSGGNGITLDSSDITLNGNYIGIHADGSALRQCPRRHPRQLNLVRQPHRLEPEGHSGTVTNVISGNGGNGIAFWGSSDNVVVGNRIGTTADGTSGDGQRTERYPDHQRIA